MKMGFVCHSQSCDTSIIILWLQFYLVGLAVNCFFEFLKTQICVMYAFYKPLFNCLQLFLSISVLSNDSCLHITCSKYFSFSIMLPKNSLVLFQFVLNNSFFSWFMTFSTIFSSTGIQKRIFFLNSIFMILQLSPL